MKKEYRVYVVDTEEDNKITQNSTDEEFMSEAERLGTVFTLKGFEKAFNDADVNTVNDFIRIIEVETAE